MTSLAAGVHTRLVKSGVDPTSKEYYDAIDARMREVFPKEFSVDVDVSPISVDIDTAQAPRRANTVVAPVQRNNGARPRKITLTASQKRLVEKLPGVTLEMYAEQLIKEGNFDG